MEIFGIRYIFAEGFVSSTLENFWQKFRHRREGKKFLRACEQHPTAKSS